MIQFAGRRGRGLSSFLPSSAGHQEHAGQHQQGAQEHNIAGAGQFVRSGTGLGQVAQGHLAIHDDQLFAIAGSLTGGNSGIGNVCGQFAQGSVRINDLGAGGVVNIAM